jgi:hypothetical protein
MIIININLQNPFSNKFENIFCKSVKLTQHKSAEVECINNNLLVEFAFSINTQCDHGGVSITVGLLGYSIQASISDNRHWNATAGQYYTYDNKGNQV